MPATSMCRVSHQNNIECQRLEKQYAKRRGNHNNGHHHQHHNFNHHQGLGMTNNGMTMCVDRKSGSKSPSELQSNILSQHFENNNLRHPVTNGSSNSGETKAYNVYPPCVHMEQRNRFRNLTHLDISGNSAEKLDLRSLDRLEWLCCSSNSLEVLYLSGNSLTYLDCSNNNLQSISIDPAPNNLTHLRISYNNLEDLPTWTWMVPELYVVYASHNRIRQLDCKFQNCLPSLPIRELHLHSNNIEFVSKDFLQRASRLRILNLSQNMVEFMPNFAKKSSLQELYMSRNRLHDTDGKEALDFILECSQLKRLHLAYNRIENISEKCTNSWKNLEELILCGNRLRTLPSKLSSLSHLKVLRVHSNQLETAPNLTKMPTLRVVDLSHNSLRKVNVETLITGNNLSYLDISCNEKLSLNPEKLHNPKRQMNLVEVTQPRKTGSTPNNLNPKPDYPTSGETIEPSSPWELGFSELPDKNQLLSITQYRDLSLSNGSEALFGLFDAGEGNSAPKCISKSIAMTCAEEKNIEESYRFPLKFTLLNAIKAMRQQGNTKPIHGLLCSLIQSDDNLLKPTPSYILQLGLIGGVRCILVERGRKVTRLTDMIDPPNGTEEDPLDKESSTTCDNNSASSCASSTDSSHDATTPPSDLNNRHQDSIPDPNVVSIALSPTAEYLVIGSRSVWNHLSEEEIVDELEMNKSKKCVLVAKRITDMAQSYSCKQSLSVLVVRFKWTTSRVMPTTAAINKLSMTTSSYYNSASSDCSDISNPLVSVTTPDSAIDTDRSSNTDSFSPSRKNSGAKIIRGRRSSSANVPRSQMMNVDGVNTNRTAAIMSHIQNKSDMARLPPGMVRKMSREDDISSLANTSLSQMSVEQFRCWEYMLEQNTRLLFKKELDSISKAAFQRNHKQRKSVHFPYQDGGSKPPVMVHSISGRNVSGAVLQNSKVFAAPKENSSSSDMPGFYTLSKAKSLSHLFSADNVPGMSTSGGGCVRQMRDNINAKMSGNNGVQNTTANGSSKSSGKALFSGNGVAGFFGSIKSAAKKGIIGGPNAAYFGSSQRFSAPTVVTQSPSVYDNGEIQEIKGYDSMEHDGRLKKYWNDKITEL